MLNQGIASTYPVDPIYSSGTFHFDQDLSDNLESLTRIYANATFVSEKLYCKIGQEYEQKAYTYLSRLPKTTVVSSIEFTGTILPPSHDAIW